MTGEDRRRRGLVYSTGHGRMCPDCGRPSSGCECREPRAPLPADGVVRVGRQTKGRKGKGVTVITGVPLPPADLEKLAAELRRKCGSGGTVKDGVIELQGEHRDPVVAELTRRGWTVKRSG